MEQNKSNEKFINYEESLFHLNSLGSFLIVYLFTPVLKGIVGLLTLYQKARTFNINL